MLDRDPARDVLGDEFVPRPRGPYRTLSLGFDRGEIDARLAGIDSHTLRPRYQSDLIDPADRARFDRELAPASRGASVLVLDTHSGETHALSPAAAALLERCDGTRDLEAVVEIIPAPHRAAAAQCVRDLAEAGLLHPLPQTVAR